MVKRINSLRFQKFGLKGSNVRRETKRQIHCRDVKKAAERVRVAYQTYGTAYISTCNLGGFGYSRHIWYFPITEIAFEIVYRFFEGVERNRGYQKSCQCR